MKYLRGGSQGWAENRTRWNPNLEGRRIGHEPTMTCPDCKSVFPEAEVTKTGEIG